MTNEEAIEVLRTESIELGGSAPIVCRFWEALDMAIAALREQEGKDTNAPTNADRINSMTIEEKADFLSSIAYGRETPWSEPSARRLCDSCPTVHGTYESGIEDDFHECDFVDGKCPHGSDIVWWLKQPAEEETLNEQDCRH